MSAIDYANEIRKLKKDKNAIILAHTYQPGEVQDIADFVGDSYGLSVRAAEEKSAEIIVFAGVRFMAETAKILSPDKKVILPVPDAGCPMADMITAEELKEFKNKYPGYIVMTYVNSTAEVKAESDICCTSSNALKIVKKIPDNQGILFVPDKHLGTWVKEKTGRNNIIVWEGFCPTHVKISIQKLTEMKNKYPNAELMIHPEAPKNCRDFADHVFSTGQMCEYVKNSTSKEFIVATEEGIIHTLKKQNPDKIFYHVGSNIICPNMKKGSIESIYNAMVDKGGEEIIISEDIAGKAFLALNKMLEMSK